MTPSTILAFQTRQAELDVVGGKGRSLSEMTLAGLPVPPGFHITTAAYRDFVTSNHLQAQILSEAARPGQQAEASAAIGRLFAGTGLSPLVAQDIKEAYALLGECPAVAVRSSANAEDLPDMSFAGQQDTYLNIIGEDALLAAVRNCWVSLWTPRAISYREQMGIDHDQVAMAVVVQVMVEADVSGILFTANPATGERSEMIANASYGLGEAIVSGEVTPDTYVFDRDQNKVKETMIGAKDRMIISDGEGGTIWQEVSASRKNRSSLSEAHLEGLVQLALKSEQHFGGAPQDIEWAVKDDVLYLLQSRPITNLPPAPLKDLKWEPPAPGVTLLRRQIVENMPGPLSPLFDELYLEVGLQQGMNRSLARGQAPYTIEDMTNGNVHLTVNGYAYQRRDFKPVEGVDPAVLAEFNVKGQVEWWTRLVDLWREDWLPDYQKIIADHAGIDVTRTSDSELLHGIRTLAIEDACYWEEASKVFATAKVTDEQLQGFLKSAAPDHNFTSGMFLSGFNSRTMLAQMDIWAMAKLVSADDALSELVNRTPAPKLLAALRSHPSAGPVLDAIDQYNRTYGHQIYSLDFVEPTALEDPIPVMVALKSQVQDVEYDPRQHHAGVTRKRKSAMRAIRKALTEEQLGLFRWHLWKARHFYPHREEVVFWLGAAWPVVRTFAAELGRRMMDAGTFDQPEDVYFLRTDDIEQAIEARANGKALPHLAGVAAEARQLREARKRVHPPGAIPIEQHANAAATQKLNSADDKVMSGFAVSPGRIEGEVSVIHSPADFDKMKPNTILVCPMTTPAWTQLFSHATGLVTDIGSILAHGSIVAREFGIPAVLGLGNVTQRLKSGQHILVDGDAGIIEILD
ncbi:MAG: PEP-utilizing enzyme [Proteobacteria bacterium]|nr:PEP-utilizing enzyme [Pseudomonadota bacterium]MDA1300264.1 PEP-utilizing enzyme [Pseudomonadota bacterium]